MRKRYIYALLYGIPGFFASIPLLLVSFLIFCNPLDAGKFGPHTFCGGMNSFAKIIPIFFLPWWIISIWMGFIAGKKYEKNKTLNRKHVLTSLITTIVLILIITAFYLRSREANRPNPDFKKCDDFCSQKGYPQSSMGYPGTPDPSKVSCSCYANDGKHMLKIPFSQISPQN